MATPDFIVAIPARHDASRLPGKPLRLLAGEPLVLHVARRALAAGAREVWVAADDVRILEALEGSGVNATLTSRAHASGLWQFIPGTGKRFELEQTWWYDARRDIVDSTDAALDYLTKLYKMHGDWHLALASYNWGENAVTRAVAKNRKARKPTDYSSLKMPKETRQYVPKLQALKNIIAEPSKYGITLDPMSTGISTVVGLVVLLAVTITAITGVRAATRLQLWLLVFEYAVLLVFLTLALVRGHHAVSLSWFDPFAIAPKEMASSLVLAVFIYWGWDAAFSVNEESKDPQDAARGGLIALFVMLGLFVYAAVAFQRLLSTDELAGYGDQGLSYLGARLAVFRDRAQHEIETAAQKRVHPSERGEVARLDRGDPVDAGGDRGEDEASVGARDHTAERFARRRVRQDQDLDPGDRASELVLRDAGDGGGESGAERRRSRRGHPEQDDDEA